MLSLIYQEVKRRGLLVKLHKEGWDTVYTDLPIYDYLWVGEAVTDIDHLRRTTKSYRPYVVPERSTNIRYEHEDELYLNALPYMQFPMLKGGTKDGDEIRGRYSFWLKQYLPMVEEGTWAWIEVAESDLFRQPPPRGVVASVFANREVHLVLANYGKIDAELDTSAQYLPVGEGSAPPNGEWKLPPRSMRILRRVSAAETNNDTQR
jgi:hypothetical protein